MINHLMPPTLSNIKVVNNGSLDKKNREFTL